MNRSLPRPPSVVRAALAALAALAASACSGGGPSPDPYAIGSESFVSQPLRGAGGSGGIATGAAGAPAPAAPTEAPSDAASARTVEESDVYALSGSTLLVLNAWRGLQVLDLADPAAPALRARVPVQGTPVNLHLRGGVAFFVVRDAVGWAVATAADVFAPVAGSQLWAVDVSRPDAPAVLSRLDVAGSVQETRLVGDVLHVVSRKWSWQDVLPAPGGLPVASGGSTGDLAYVASFDVADPRAPRAVARLEMPATGWDAHVHVTTDRIALAQSGYGPSGETTRFTLVDVSDPAGALRAGASFESPGRIADRWGLDQGGGVFRAVLQNGWNGGATLRTWASATVDEATPLGRLDLVIPETLTAARFDGARVYAVTAERVDPLWVVDASDPARPVLAGQLHMPGQIEFVEPRGDRLLALGHTNEGGLPWQLAVSMIDVADPALPTLRARVLVGGGSGGVGATQDDMRKAFRILDAEGLALVPWQGWDAATWRWAGGVQLVDLDLAAGTLALRALVPHAGAVSRAFPVPGRPAWIAALSDERLQVLDATDRDAPVERASLDLARPVNAIAFFGGRAVELCGDWWRGDGALVVVPASDPDAAVSLARLELAAPQARLFRVGEVAWLLSHDFTQGKAWLEAVDLADPLQPVRRGRLEVDPAEAPGGSGGGWLGMGDEAALSGTVLAVHRSWYGPVATGLPAFAPGGGPWPADDAVVLFDLSDPDAPRRAARVALPASGWSWGLRAEAGLLWITHHEWTSGARDRVRFYLDRIDATDPDRPLLLPKVNVPGAFLGAASATRVHTQETRWDEATGVATSRVHALDLTERGTARLAGTVSLPGWLTGAVTGPGHAWAVTQEWGAAGSATRLAAIDLGAMGLAGSQRLDASWAWPVAAAGGKLFVAAGTPAGSSLLVLGLASPGAPRLERTAPTQGFAWEVVVEGGAAYVPGGAWGVTVIPLSP